MRRASIYAALLGLILSLGLAGVASAAPKVTMRAEAVPIPKYPHTGNIYGAGAALKVKFKISGTEYGGFPPPLVGVNFFFPKGTKLHTKGFPTCPVSTLEPSGGGPEKCPKNSKAGPTGRVLGVVAFGKELVPEELTLDSFYAPGGGISFFAAGHSPVSVEILSKGRYTHLHGGGGFGPEVVTEVPLVETVPGAQDASAEEITVQAGSAIKKGKRTIYYGTLPKKGECPKGGFKIKAEMMFAGLAGLSPVTVPVSYKARCPRR